MKPGNNAPTNLSPLELARTRVGEEAQPVLDRIERDSLRLGELISEILQLTRLDAGEPGTEVEPVTLDEVADLVLGVAADVDFEAKGMGRAVATEITGMGAGSMSARPELLRRAVENVLRNAVRFTAEGTNVECSLSRNGTEVEIAVRDHGPGVPEEALSDIFRPFFRVESARDRNTGGAGIGLAIVERAVRLHRGTVVAENAEGGGLRIRMRLPMSVG
jgi:two-component system sensor histidine kinase CpxA